MVPTILLFNPISTSPGKQRLPMSILAVGSTLVGDYRPEFIDGNLIAEPAQHIIERTKITGAKVLGVTAMPGPQLKQAIEVCKQVKTALPELIIIWGGYFATHHGAVCLESSIVDYVIEGQGEIAFRKLIDALHHGGDLAEVPSLVWKAADGIRTNPRAPLVPLDELPLWPYDLLDDPLAYRGKSYLGERVMSHHTSFGCPFACNFCAVVKLVNQRWLPESPERVEKVVRLMVEKYGADAIEFHDMDFFIREDRAAEIAERLTPLGINWWALGRIDKLSTYSDATWEKIKKSGCKMIFMGAETGSDAMLKRMNKGGTSSTSKTLEMAAKLKRLGIVPEFSFVMGNPPDPMGDIDNTIQFIRQVKRINPAAELILYIYTPVPHDRSELLKVAQELGFEFPQTLEEWASEEWERFALRRDPNTSYFKDTARRKVRDFEIVINAYYPTVTDIRLEGGMRKFLKGLSGWRYQLGWYKWPYELKALQRLVHYRRPETTGF
jgi:anaerobic magnesium-protoporphyrin IX monomethyl ester cyclase